jgi:pyruvate/2-oxoglutarate dehydrogenase complex dihydrolipoamide acyltransferase (E2) component
MEDGLGKWSVAPQAASLGNHCDCRQGTSSRAAHAYPLAAAHTTIGGSLNAKGVAGAKLTYTDLLIACIGYLASRNASDDCSLGRGEIRLRSQIVLGLAVATDRGVVAPLWADANRLPLAQIVTRRTELADRARQSRLTFVA